MSAILVPALLCCVGVKVAEPLLSEEKTYITNVQEPKKRFSRKVLIIGNDGPAKVTLSSTMPRRINSAAISRLVQ